MPTETVDCVGCGRKVKLNKYNSKSPYTCAKCRGIEIPKRPSKRREPEEFKDKVHYSAMRYGG